MTTCPVKNFIGKALLIDNLHRHIAIPSLGHLNASPFADIDNGNAVERVAIQALAAAAINISDSAAMGKAVEFAVGYCQVLVELDGGFGAHIV